MRGKLICVAVPGTVSRITPAHAGKTCKSGIAYRDKEDHPRACGENIKSFEANEGWLGSPPRMRGKPVKADWRLKNEQEHPRACGENTGANAQKYAQ